MIALVEVKGSTGGDPRHETNGFATWLWMLAEVRLARFLELFTGGAS